MTVGIIGRYISR